MEQHSKQKIIDLEIYTDGSAKSIGRKIFGGWAFVAIEDNKEIFRAADGVYDTTNQRMELTAVVQALQWASENRRQNQLVTIHSDSAYIINCYRQQWYKAWQNNGWKNSKGDDVANADLWGEIIPYFSNYWYLFTKVAGHAGDFWNERCDEYAQYEADRLKKNWRG